ncbi:MAG: response regulator [Bdellovibrio sp.]
MKILLVDDFEMVRVMLRNTLEGLGYTDIEEAEDGRVALVKIKEAQKNSIPYEMVFCDWNMPDVTGLEVLESCRGQLEFKSLPIVMVTAESERQQVVRALKAGATDYIVKPVTPEILEKKINQIIARLNKKAS